MFDYVLVWAGTRPAPTGYCLCCFSRFLFCRLAIARCAFAFKFCVAKLSAYALVLSPVSISLEKKMDGCDILAVLKYISPFYAVVKDL